jgi:crooked neck
VLFEAEPIPVPRAEREEGEEEDDEDTEPKAVPGEANLAKQVFERGYKDLKSRG